MISFAANGTVSLEILTQDQNVPESLPQPIPAVSIEDKHQASTAGLPSESPQTESPKDNVATEAKDPVTEKYDPTTAPSIVEAATPVKNVKGEVLDILHEEPTTTKYEPEQATHVPGEELPAGTTTRVELPEVDPVKDPSQSDISGTAQPEDSEPTTASPTTADASPAHVESHDSDDSNTLTVVSVDEEPAEAPVTTEAPLPEAPTSHVADDKVEEPVTSEPVIEHHDDKTTATFVTASNEYATTSPPVVKHTCEKHGQVFQLHEPVPASLVTDNPCVVNCTCQRKNAITCGVTNCPPKPPNFKNCVPIRHEGVCCPTYACGKYCVINILSGVFCCVLHHSVLFTDFVLF